MIHLTIKMIPQIDAKLADHTYMIISVVGLVQLSVNLQLGLGVVVLLNCNSDTIYNQKNSTN